MTFFGQFTKGVKGTPSSRFYKKNKKSGGYRLIGAPNKAMEEIQEKIRVFLERIAPRCWSAAASKGGLGSIRNARVHLGKKSWERFVFTLDLSHAFDSTNGKLLAKIIAERAKKFILQKENVLTSSDWYEFLSRYCLTRRGGLIQGALTSSLLMDWYCEVMLDKPIRKFIYGLDICYTRYVDDLVFSTNCGDPITRRMRGSIRRIIANAGYLENHRKTEVANLSSPGKTVRITGPRIGLKHFGLPRKNVKAMERMLDTALRFPLIAEKSEVIDGKLRYLLDVVRGKNNLNKLEARTIEMYRKWCLRNGKDANWPTKVLARKPVIGTPRRKKNKKEKKKRHKFPENYEP